MSKTISQVGLVAAALALFIAPAAQANVVTYIDLFNTTQIISTNNATVTTTVASSGAIGGYRTMTLNTLGGDPPEAPPNSGISVSAATQRFTLSTPAEATTAFEIKWGGIGGTNGLGGYDFANGLPYPIELVPSTLNFALRSADQPSSYTWTFTDTANNVASYTGSLPAKSSSSPALPYAISLASFTGAGSVDWNSINFITLAGGGLELDLTLAGGGISMNVVAVPEPGTWASAGLLMLCALYLRWRRSRGSEATQEAPAAA